MDVLTLLAAIKGVNKIRIMEELENDCIIFNIRSFTTFERGKVSVQIVNNVARVI